MDYLDPATELRRVQRELALTQELWKTQVLLSDRLRERLESIRAEERQRLREMLIDLLDELDEA